MTVFFCWIRPMASLTFFKKHIFGRGCFRCYIPVNLPWHWNKWTLWTKHDNGTNGPWMKMYLVPIENCWFSIAISSVPLGPTTFDPQQKDPWHFSLVKFAFRDRKHHDRNFPANSGSFLVSGNGRYPLMQENSSGWWNIVIWPDQLFHEHISHVSLPTTWGAAGGIDLSHKAWVYPIIVAWTWGYGWLASMNSVGRF